MESWSSWEHGLAELKGALRGDCDTVRLIEAALAAGGPARVAPHVTQLARLLSETTNQVILLQHILTVLFLIYAFMGQTSIIATT